MREIVLDTETTGFDPSDGHRIVEIGCVELFDHCPTGEVFHVYLNPERDIPAESQKVHGLSAEFLADKPLFSAVCEDFLTFIAGDPLVIHNAAFDLRFLNAELARQNKPAIAFDRAIDTIEIAKAKLPGARYSLDELCKRFAIDLSAREKHGALLDAELTAKVYLELLGGRQRHLSLAPTDVEPPAGETAGIVRAARPRPHALAPRRTQAEAEAHDAFIAKELGESAVWKRN